MSDLKAVQNPFLARRSRRPRPSRKTRFESNQAAVDAAVGRWTATLSSRYVGGLRACLNRFVAYLGEASIYDQTTDDLEDYLDNVADQCRFYRSRGFDNGHGHIMPPMCDKGQPLDCLNCPVYEGLKNQSVAHHVIAVKKLYKELVRLKHIPVNIAQAASDAWWEEHKRLVKKEKVAAAEEKRFLKRQEAVQWIDKTTEIKWATYELATLRYGFRGGEMARLRADPPYLDPDLKWFRVPQAPGNDGKRLATIPYPIDDEVRPFFKMYLRWRKAKLDRLGVETNLLFFNQQGRPYPQTDKSAAGRLNPSLRRTARKAGLDDPESITSHIGRRFFTDTAQQNGVHANELKLIRGDFLQSEATGSYTDTSRLATLWRKASPPLGVKPPRGYYLTL